MHSLQSINGCAIQKIWFKTKTNIKRGMRQAKPAAFLDHSDRNSDRNSDAVCSNEKILTRKVEKSNIGCRQYFLLYSNLLTFLVEISSEEQLAAERHLVPWRIPKKITVRMPTRVQTELREISKVFIHYSAMVIT